MRISATNLILFVVATEPRRYVGRNSETKWETFGCNFQHQCHLVLLRTTRLQECRGTFYSIDYVSMNYSSLNNNRYC